MRRLLARWPPCGLTVEPALFFYFLAIFLLYSVFQPLVFSKVCTTHLARLADTTCANLSDANITCDDMTNTSNTCADIADINMTCANLANASITCINVGSFNSQLARQTSHAITADTNHWIKLSSISAALPSLLGDMMLGSWSDVFGRRMPLLLPSVGGLLAAGIYIALTVVSALGVQWLCAASLLSGLFGGYTGMVASSFAYLASVVEPATMSQRASLAEGCIFLAATLGPFLSAALHAALGLTGVFVLHALCHVANLIYCLLLPDPGSGDRKPVSLKGLLTLRHFYNSVHTVVAPRRGRTAILALLLAFFLFQAATSGELDILFLFLKDIIGLGPASKIFSPYFGYKNGLGALALFVLLPLLKSAGLPDHPLCLVGLLSGLIGLVSLAFSSSIVMVFISGLLGGLAKFADPLLRSLISQEVEPVDVGKVFGVVAVCGDLGNMAGTLVFNSIYSPLRAMQPGCAEEGGDCLAGLAPLAAAGLVLLAGGLVGLAWGAGGRGGRQGGQDNQAYQEE